MSRLFRYLAPAVAGAIPVVAVPAVSPAQTPLPEIVVQAPSPIITPTQTDAVETESQAGTPSLLNGLIIADDVFSPVTIISGEQATQGTSRTIGDVVFSKPGVTSSTFAPGASRPIIRGLDNFRVRVQENGIGVHDVSDLSEDHAIPVDVLNQGKIEIIRGPATLRWGSQAIGGVVSVTNNRIPDYIPPGGFLRATTTGGYTSVDDGSEGAFMVEGGDGVLAFHVDGFRREGGDYDIPGAPGKQANSFYEADGNALGGSLVFDRGYFGLSVSRYSSLYGIPGEEAAEREVRIDLEQTKLTGKGEWRPVSGAIEAVRTWFGISDYEHDEIARHDPGDPLEVGSTFVNRQREGRTEVQFRRKSLSIGQLDSAIGLQLGERKLSGSGEAGELIAPATTKRIAGYVFEELATSPTLKFQLAGRVEHVDINGTAALFPGTLLPPPNEPTEEGRNPDFTPVSASAGLLKTLPRGIKASFNMQYVERAPEAPELFSKGPHEATGTFEIGNPDLEIEKARSVEFGLRRAEGRFRFDSTVFHTQYDGFIYKFFTGIACGEEFADCGVEDELNQILYSQQDATFYGGEFQAELDVMPVWRGMFGIDGQFDIVKASFADNTNVPRITPARVGGGVFYRDQKLSARVGLLHAFEQDNVGVNETSTDGYTLLNAELNYLVGLGRSQGEQPWVTFGITGENLLDDDVRNHASFKKDGVLLPGRSVKLRAKIRLN